jgi:YHS domain-containing protein
LESFLVDYHGQLKPAMIKKGRVIVMKQLITPTRLLLLLVILSGLTVAGLAQTAKKDVHQGHQHSHQKASEKESQKFLGKGDGVETCPVTGEAILNKDVKGVFYGRTVYFCCPGCLAKTKMSPAAYIKKTQAEQIAATKNLPKSEGHDHGDQDAQKGEQKFLGKGDGIETCPVTGEPVNKNVKAEINGRTVYACCEMCLETVKKNPDLYLKKDSGAKSEQAFLGKGDGIETCPVTGEPVNKDFKAEFNGKTVYVCCPSCLDTIKQNPDLYLKKNSNK